jgi:transcriptional regulatory protein RtcR
MEKTGKHISFSKESRMRFLAFARDKNTPWAGNFRDLNAMVVRMATLADGGRITTELVNGEIARMEEDAASAAPAAAPSEPADLTPLLGQGYAERYDDFDLVQLAHVVDICRASDSAADAARKLYAVSLKSKASANHTDRLSKYLAKFGLKFKNL